MADPKSYLINLYPNLALTQLAKLWAEGDENLEVEPGKFSSKHHRIIAAQAAVEAAASALQSAADALATAEDKAAIDLIYLSIQPIADNIAEVLAVQENVPLLTTIEPYLTELASIHTNLTALLAVAADLAPLNVINDNIVSLTSIADNLAQILAAAEGAEAAIAAAALAEQHAIDANAGKAAFENMLLEAQQLYLDMANNYFFYPEVNALRLRVFNEEASYLLPLRLLDASLDAYQAVYASFIMLPFAAKAGKIYSILPADGSGDLVVTRNTAKTVIDKDGMPLDCPANMLLLDYSTGVPGWLIENAATNLIVNPLSPATQDVAVSAVPYTLQFWGSGTIVLSGARSYTFTGSGVRNTYTFTPTAGTLTLTITGDVKFCQLETGSSATSFVNGSRDADVVTTNLANFKSYVRNDYLYLFADGNPNPYTLPLGLTKRLIFSKNIFSLSEIQSLEVFFEPVNPILIPITSSGASLSTLSMNVSALTIFSLGNLASFFDDLSGTLNESKVWIIYPGARRTKYLKLAAGTDTLSIPDKSVLSDFGTDGSYAIQCGSTHSRVSINLSELTTVESINLGYYVVYTGAVQPNVKRLTLQFGYSSVNNGPLPEGLEYLYLTNGSLSHTFNANLPSTLTFFGLNGAYSAWSPNSLDLPAGLLTLYLQGNSIQWTNNSPIPTGLTSLYLSSVAMNYTNLDFSGTGNMTTFSLINYRTNKLTDAEFLTLLASLTNRVGGLPATIQINEYANYNNPPQSVLDAIAALKLAKNITTVTLAA